jgi:hypothetical protein
VTVPEIVIENPTSGWLVFSAIVQAAAAAAIAVLTIFLLRATNRYVDEMATANRLQASANEISGALLARQAAMETPFLVATSLGGSGSQGGRADYSMEVQNRGASLAHSISVETNWGEVSIESLAAGDSRKVQIGLAGGWDGNSGPEPRRFRFRDPHGVEWVQLPNRLPERSTDKT